MTEEAMSEVDLARSFTLKGEGLDVRITNFGARILEFCYQGVDMICGPKTPDELRADTCYCGSICGRVANRIAGGQFELDGKLYPLAVNNGPNHLHGGTRGYDARRWKVEEAAEDHLTLFLFSPDGEEGYPGALQVRATYSIIGQELTLEFRARSDAPTLLNLTNHAYWNLAGRGGIEQHHLQVLASAYTPMVQNIPTGHITPVQGTLYDLNTPTPLGERLAALGCGLDDNYVLHAESGVRDAAVLSCGERTLTVSTDAPGLQVYTGDYLPQPRAGIALEAQSYPDSPHHPHFPSILLPAGDIYHRTISWRIS